KTFGVEKGSHPRDLVSHEFENDEGPGFEAAFRIRTVLREGGPTAGCRGNEVRAAATAADPQHPGANVGGTLDPHGVRRHAERDVFAHQHCQLVDVVALEGGHVADEHSLLGFGEVGGLVFASGGERCTGALESAIHGGHGGLECFGGFGGGATNDFHEQQS